MSKVQVLRGVLKTFWWMTMEDWQQLDRKFYRIVFGAAGFIVVALFWFYFLRNVFPYPF